MPKTALVTGGAKGIGLGSVRALVGQGWNVAFTGRDTQALHRCGGAADFVGSASAWDPALCH